MSIGDNHRNPPPLTAASRGSQPTESPGTDGIAPRRLSEELQRLIESFAERSVRLREVLEVMHGRGYTMLLILVTFPFCTPIPLPSFSAPRRYRTRPRIALVADWFQMPPATRSRSSAHNCSLGRQFLRNT